MSRSGDTAAAALAEYGNYLRMAVKNPELGSWSMARKHLKLPTVQKVWDAETINSERYLWFVAYMLHVLDRVLAVAPEYKCSIVKHIGHHREIIGELWGKHWAIECSAEIGKLVEAVTGVSADA